MAEAFAAIRFIHFAAVMAAFGIAAFRLYAFAGVGLRRAPAFAELDAVLARMTAAATILALLSALAIVPCVAAEMTGSDAAALDPSLARVVLFDTEFGKAWCWHTGFTIVLAVLCLMPRGGRQEAATSLVALLTLASLGWVGHAAMDMGDGKSHTVNQMAHLIAGGLWLGGLLPLCLLLRRATRADGAAYAPLARAALPHFSQIGYVAVALLAITGTVNAIMLVGGASALFGTPYGRLLLLKIALFAAMVGLALVNRFRLMPRVAHTETAAPSLRALYRSVVAEQALSLLILAVVAVLGTWPPANDHM